MITHEEILNAICKRFNEEIQSLIIKYVKQQEKKDELLGLYRKRDSNIDHLTCSQITKLDDEIDELEKRIGGNKMSREMTPKEALEILVDNIDKARLKELSISDDYWTVYEEINEAINVLENSMAEEIENPPKQNLTKPSFKRLVEWK